MYYKRSSLPLLLIASLLIGIFLLHQLFFSAVEADNDLSITVPAGASAHSIASQLKDAGIIRSQLGFRVWVKLKKAGSSLQAGEKVFHPPFSLNSIIASLTTTPEREERAITILPGWTMAEVGEALAKQGLLAQATDIEHIVGKPYTHCADCKKVLDGVDVLLQQDKPSTISYEGYIRPDTFRFFVEDTAEDVLARLLIERDKEITAELRQEINKQGRTIHEVITLASILEKEVRSEKDRALVADLFWRRVDNGWPLQADSTVHYIVGRNGTVFTSAKDRDTDSAWNTYKYPGLPPGPISTPSIESIHAVVYPEPNDAWYFLTTLDTGEVKYGRTLDEHNQNVQTYLR